MRMDRTSSMGLWTYARYFFDAARILIDSKSPHIETPAYYLISHSIELCLKAFLRGSGLSIEELKALGHNLDKCLEKAISLGLEFHMDISDLDKFAVSAINPYYQEKELEYIKTGFRQLPKIALLVSFADNLLNGTRQFCRDQRRIHEEKKD